MLVLITYDVNTETKEGKTRLRKVAKICVNYGQRVQNSVFECLLTSAEKCIVKSKLLDIIDENKDSLRFYNIGNNYESKIEHYGAKASYAPEEPLIF
jgi:CRISPR-associated protein Cas2